MDRLTALSVFRCVAETGSFSKAGARLGMAPSSVSKSIGRLEAALGVRLLARTTRVVSLTDDGAAYFESVRTALAALDEAETVLKRAASEPSGLLRIALPLSFGRRRIVPHLPAFLARYPDLELDVRLSDDFSRPVDEGIDALVRVGEGPEQSLVVRKVGITHRVICGSPGYLARHGVPTNARELVKHRLVRFPRFTGFFDWATLVPSHAVLSSRRGTIQLNDGESLTAAALAGAGLILVLDVLVDEEIKAGRLRTVLDELRPPPRPISVAYPVARHLSPKVRAFVDFVVSLFESSLKGKRPRGAANRCCEERLATRALARSGEARGARRG